MTKHQSDQSKHKSNNRRRRRSKNPNETPKPQTDDKMAKVSQNNHAPNKSSKHKRRRPRKRGVDRTASTRPKELISCPICAKQINDTKFTFVDEATGKKAHFDCIMDRIRKSEGIEKGQKLYYLGGGSFGVVEERKSKNKFDIQIKRRFTYDINKKGSKTCSEEQSTNENSLLVAPN
jgi:hypothetical protein